MLGEQTFYGPDVYDRDAARALTAATNLDPHGLHGEVVAILLESNGRAAPELGPGVRVSHATGRAFYSARWLD